MMMKLIKKDITAYGLFIFIGYASQLLLSSVMIIYARDDSWRTFVFVGCVQISAVILFYLSYEKMRHFDNLLFSLPLNRNQIVLSRYVSTIIITLTGLAVWHITASYINSTFSTVPTDFNEFISFKTVSAITIFFSLFISLFIPLTIRTKQVLILVVPLMLIAYFYVMIAQQIKPYGETEIQTATVIFILLMVIVPLSVSYYTSIRLIRNMDIA